MIANLHFHGDLTQEGSFREDDRRILASSRWTAKIKRTLERLPVNVEMHFVHRKPMFGSCQYMEIDHFYSKHVGFVTAADVENKYETAIPETQDAMTVALVENEGEARIALTPWMVLHRVSHAFIIRGATSPYMKDVEKFVYEIMKVAGFYSSVSQFGVCKTFGDTAYIRNGNVYRNMYEWFNDCFAQQFVCGRVKFKQAVPIINHDNKDFSLTCLTADVNHRFNLLAEMLMQIFDRWVTEAVGKILVL